MKATCCLLLPVCTELCTLWTNRLEGQVQGQGKRPRRVSEFDRGGVTSEQVLRNVRCCTFHPGDAGSLKSMTRTVTCEAVSMTFQQISDLSVTQHPTNRGVCTALSVHSKGESIFATLDLYFTFPQAHTLHSTSSFTTHTTLNTKMGLLSSDPLKEQQKEIKKGMSLL